MAQPQVFEGTWDEVNAELSNRSEEWRGYGRLRLVVVPEEAPSPQATGETLAEALADLLDAADRIERETPVPHTDPHEIAFGEIMREKYRKMGLNV